MTTREPMQSHVLVAGSGNITGLNIIRDLKSNTYQEILCSGYDSCPVDENAAEMICKNYQAPPTTAPTYVAFVLDLCNKLNITHIITSNDHDLRALSEARHFFENAGILVNGVNNKTHAFLDKLETWRVFMQAGIRTPKLVDMLEVTHENFPVVVRKQSVGGAKKFTNFCATPLDLYKLGSEILSQSIVTELVKGKEYTIDVLCDESSRALYVVPRLRRKVTAGAVTFAEAVDNESLIEEVRYLTKNVGVKGVACIQCIEDEAGQFWFFEVNARPGSGSDLSTACGINMSSLWVHLTSGALQKPPLITPVWGMKMLRYGKGFFFT